MKKSPLFVRLSAFIHFAAALMVAGRAHSQITVTTLADENDTPAGAQVSLREAVRDSATGGQINFGAALSGKVLILTNGEMVVAGKTLSVDAPAGGLVVEARGRSRIFRVQTGAGLNLTGLALQGGLTRAGEDGGAILNHGTLNLTDCMLTNNRAGDGADGAPGGQGAPGSIAATPGQAGGSGSHGGAISSTGSISAVRCTFAGNRAGTGGNGGRGGDAGVGYPQAGPGGNGGLGGNGGAIRSTGTLQLTECVFHSNASGFGGTGGPIGSPQNVPNYDGGTSGDGGAIHQSGSLNIERCTFTGNSCPPGGLPNPAGNVPPPFGLDTNQGGRAGSGAGVYLASGNATLTNCTFTANRTAESGRWPSQGGAVAGASPSQLRLVHCTVAGNLGMRVHSPDNADSTWHLPASAGIGSEGSVLRDNCIISGNMVDGTEVNGTQGTPLGGTPGGNALLGALALTSGPLPVLVPGSGSPALNAGAVLASPPATDQRGLPRAVDVPDLGAVEVQAEESAPRLWQTISFSPPLSAAASTVSLSATASSNLPVSLELISGPATLDGATLTFTGPGFAAVRASQAGDAATAPALSVVRLIEAPHGLPFKPAATHTVYPASPGIVTLPDTTTAGLPVTWSFAGNPVEGITLSGNLVTAASTGTVDVRGQNPGDAEHVPVDVTWTLTFVQGNRWWETPPAIGGGPHWFTLVEGSPHGLRMTARISAPHSAPVPVPALPPGITATPSAVPAGQTSVQCVVTVNANPLLTNQTQFVGTGYPTPLDITLVLVNRTSVPLSVSAPATVAAGTSAPVRAGAGSVFVPQMAAMPPDISPCSVTVTAVDFDDPSVSVPVILGEVTNEGSLLPTKLMQVTFPMENRRLRLTVTTDDGISGTSGPIQITGGTEIDTNLDRDGISDIVEAALQRTRNEFHEPPLTFERDAAGLHVILANRPVDLKGWTVTIETSTDLQTWTAASAAATTVIPNPDGTTERVSVLLTSDREKHFVRLTAAKP